MDWNWKQLVGAFVMGVLMPGVTFGAAATTPVTTVPAETKPPSIITTIPETPPAAATVDVILLDGTVQQMELESYITGVVLGEMPVNFESESLKAQAVVARTYTLWCSGVMRKHENGDVCADFRCCQAYKTTDAFFGEGGSAADLEKLQAAVKSTAGQVVTYGGQLIEATYFSCSGGRTEAAQAVWGTDVPYLQSVVSPGEEWAEPYTHTIRITAAQLQSCLGRWLAGTPENWFGVTTYTEGGGVATMYIAGRSYTGTQLRQLLNLNSTAFSVIADPEGITVTTAGKGHRVGMSQYGAEAMAAKGSGYAEILAYYYPGTRIDKMESIG